MEWIQSITDYFQGNEVAAGTLMHALLGLAILIVGLFVVNIISNIMGSVLRRISFLQRVDENGDVITDFVQPIRSLIKGVLSIFVLMAVLQHFGLTDVLAPLKELVNKFLSAVPNIIGAGVIAYAGWIIATLVSQVVGVALGPVDRQIAERTNNESMRIAPFGSAFIFGGVLLPIVVAALGVLNIPAISNPASAMIEKLMAAVPNIVGAGMILLVTYFVTRFVVYILNGLLEGMHINTLPEKIGLNGIFTPTFTPIKLIGGGIMFFSMVSAATAAVNVLGIDTISQIFARVLEFGGGILVGGLILVVGNWLSTLAYDKLSMANSKGMANVARIAIIGLVLAMGLRAMGLADNIVNMAFGFTIGSVAVAVALAFGLGGRDAAKVVADRWASRLK